MRDRLRTGADDGSRIPERSMMGLLSRSTKQEIMDEIDRHNPPNGVGRTADLEHERPKGQGECHEDCQNQNIPSTCCATSQT